MYISISSRTRNHRKKAPRGSVSGSRSVIKIEREGCARVSARPKKGVGGSRLYVSSAYPT